MSLDVLFALLAFAFITSNTPGPNNLMLLASGVNFGFRRTLPHMLGIAGGFLCLMLAIGLGLGALLTAFPVLHTVLKIAGGSYLVYLAWRIATARSVDTGEDGETRPMTFWEAAAFQLVNPKAWVVSISTMTIYTSPQASTSSVMVVALVFTLASAPSLTVWTGFGLALRDFLAHPVRLKWFNIVMAVLLVASLWPMLR